MNYFNWSTFVGVPSSLLQVAMQVTDQETEVRPAEFLVQSNCGPLFCGCSLTPRLNLYNLPCKSEARCRGVTWVWGGGEERSALTIASLI